MPTGWCYWSTTEMDCNCVLAQQLFPLLRVDCVNVIKVQLVKVCYLLHLPLGSSVQCQWPSRGQSLLVTWHWWRWAAAVYTERRQRRPETWGAGRRYDGLRLVLAEAGTGRGQSGVKKTEVVKHGQFKYNTVTTLSPTKPLHLQYLLLREKCRVSIRKVGKKMFI